jgi:hypothetical protein
VCDATLVRRAISRLGDQLFEVQCAFEHRQGSEGALSVAKLLKALLDLRLSEDDAAFALERYGKVFTFPVDFSCFLQIYADVTGLLRKSKGHSDDDEDGRMWVEYAPAKWKPLSPTEFNKLSLVYKAKRSPESRGLEVEGALAALEAAGVLATRPQLMRYLEDRWACTYAHLVRLQDEFFGRALTMYEFVRALQHLRDREDVEVMTARVVLPPEITPRSEAHSSPPRSSPSPPKKPAGSGNEARPEAAAGRVRQQGDEEDGPDTEFLRQLLSRREGREIVSPPRRKIANDEWTSPDSPVRSRYGVDAELERALGGLDSDAEEETPKRRYSSKGREDVVNPASPGASDAPSPAGAKVKPREGASAAASKEKDELVDVTPFHLVEPPLDVSDLIRRTWRDDASAVSMGGAGGRTSHMEDRSETDAGFSVSGSLLSGRMGGGREEEDDEEDEEVRQVRSRYQQSGGVSSRSVRHEEGERGHTDDEAVRHLFETYDLNGDGVISFLDLKTFFAQKGRPVANHEVR